MTQSYWEDVRKHQFNSSTSKSTYAFPKQKRFTSTNKALCDSFYNIPTTMGKSQKCGIGLGNKVSLIRKSQSPSPSKYIVKTQFDMKRNISMGKFSLGRQNIKYNGIFVKNQTPQPGHYQIRTNIMSNHGILIHSKLNQTKYSNSKNPGPGHYNSITTLNQAGKYVVSNFQNCPGPKLKNTKAYDPEKNKIVPGPGAYQNKQNLNTSGSYFNSRFEGSRCRTFSRSSKHQDKQFQMKKKIPGPGSYNMFTQFGGKTKR